MWKDFFYFTKTERQGIIVLVVLIIGVFSIPRLVQLFSTPQEVTPEEDEKFKLEYDEFISSIKEIKPQRKFAEGDPPKNYSYSPKEAEAKKKAEEKAKQEKKKQTESKYRRNLQIRSQNKNNARVQKFDLRRKIKNNFLLPF